MKRWIDLDLPPEDVYGLLVRFEDYPAFVGGLARMERVGTDEFRWVAEARGVKRTGRFRITQRVPPRAIAFVTDAFESRGRLSVRPAGPSGCRVTVELRFDSEVLCDTFQEIPETQAVGIVFERLEEDLLRFGAFAETALAERSPPGGRAPSPAGGRGRRLIERSRSKHRVPEPDPLIDLRFRGHSGPGKW